MRHDQIAVAHSYNRVDMAARWPASPHLTPPPAPEALAEAGEAFVPTAAAPDVPAGAGIVLAASYVGLIGAFALVTAASGKSLFAIAICLVFVAMFFAVPLTFLRVEPKQGRRVCFERFLTVGMETLTGHSSGPAALVQMLIVPVLLTFGVLLIGLAKAILL